MKVVPIPEGYKDDVKALLEECIGEEFDAVVLVGLWKDSKTFKIKASKIPDRLMMLGAITEMQQHVLDRGL